ncbi:signal peptide peptidase-like protein 2 [Tanacetum coccineum]
MPPLVIDNTRQPLMSDMTMLLNDLSYIPPNNEHNEPNQGDIGETNFMAKFTYFKAKGRLTDSIFNEMLEFFQNIFPIIKGLKLPPSYYAIKKTFKMIRWKDSNTPGKKVPKKVLCYFPIIPRLQCLYKSSDTANDMIWYATGKCTKPGKMQHPVDGGAWKKFDTNSFMLTLLIPGPKSPGKDIDVYLRPLIKDLKVLHDQKGVETIDVASGQKFNMRAIVLWTINDFSTRSSLSGWSGQGYKDALHIKVVDILCELELIYPPALFDIMVHLVIHLPIEALKGRPIHPRWMYPFERYMKKLKGYVQNKAKPKGLIAEGYVAEEALTFSSHYFWDVTMKFNHPDHNIRQRYLDNDQDPEVSITIKLFALANGPSWTPVSVNSAAFVCLP